MASEGHHVSATVEPTTFVRLPAPPISGPEAVSVLILAEGCVRTPCTPLVGKLQLLSSLHKMPESEAARVRVFVRNAFTREEVSELSVARDRVRTTGFTPVPDGATASVAEVAIDARANEMLAKVCEKEDCFPKDEGPFGPLFAALCMRAIDFERARDLVVTHYSSGSGAPRDTRS
jgi:hypothetical protein